MDQEDVLPNLGGLGGPDHAGVNRLFREVLRERGFQWCDDNGQEQYAAEVLDRRSTRDGADMRSSDSARMM